LTNLVNLDMSYSSLDSDVLTTMPPLPALEFLYELRY
jgi:hypothetical protein